MARPSSSPNFWEFRQWFGILASGFGAITTTLDGRMRALLPCSLPMLQRIADTAVLTVISALYAMAVFALKFRQA